MTTSPGWRPEPDALARAAADPARRLGRFIVLDRIGRGGMGEVHRGWDPSLDRAVAIKTLGGAGAPPGSDSERALARFEREATAAARLRHPGIVAVHEVGRHAGRPFIVMDLVEGDSLEALLRSGPVPRDRMVILAREIALAVDHAHGQGILHRDVKPENILVDRDGRARLADFGLARATGDAERLTLSGQVVGTPGYLAPEQVEGRRADRQGPATDVWGVGATLYRALVGRPPFDGGDVASVLARVVFAEPEAPRAADPSIHPDLETIVLRCLEKEPERRYASAAALAEDLRRFADGEVIEARPIGRLGRAARWSRRRRALTAALGVAAALVLGTSGWGVATVARAAGRARSSLADEARAAALEARTRFEDARREPPPPAAARRSVRERTDALLALGLDALEASGRRLTLAPDDRDARRERLEVALVVAEVARDGESWGIGAGAVEVAASLELDAARVSRARDAVETARRRAQEERERRVAVLLASARLGEAFARPNGFDDALFAIVAEGRHGRVVDQLARALDEVTTVLGDAFVATYLEAAEATPEERRAGAGPSEGLAAALARRRGGGADGPIDPADAALLERAAQRLERRAARAVAIDERAAIGVAARRIVAAAQHERAGPAALDTARLCCEALGFLGERAARERAVDAVVDYLDVERDERRAAPAVAAAVSLGGRRAEAAVSRALDRFGRDGPVGRASGARD